VFDAILQEVGDIRKALQKRFKWTVYRVHNEDHLFTSDNPVSWVKETEEMIFPITCKHVARGKIRGAGEPFSFHYSTASKSKADRFNTRTLRGAKDFLYHPIDSDKTSAHIKANARPVSHDPMDPMTGRSWGHDAKPVTKEELQALVDRIAKERAKQKPST
jgi:hypothetical protein